jgi:3-hydroxybutyryl-CoA dehydrogenase
MTERVRVAVIGAGTMGNGIAHAFAQHAHDVVLVDVAEAQLERARATIAGNLERQVRKGSITAEQRDGTLSHLQTTTSIGAASGSALIVEAVPEQRELKQQILRSLDTVADDAIVATNTSSISVTDLATYVSRPDRFIGMHFMNPVPIMKLVEVIRGLQTSDETMQAVMQIARGLDKTPVEVNDGAGFVSNRVLMPMINEAIFCLMEGVAEPEAIDTVMKLGMNHPMGPLALADLIGLDTCLSILEVLQRDLGDDKYRPCPLLRKYVAAGWHGRKAGRGFYSYEGA